MTRSQYRIGRSVAVLVGGFLLLAFVATLTPSAEAQLNPGRLQGKVVDEDGNPIAGFEILFVPTGDSARGERKVKSGRNGTFNVSFFPSGSYKPEAVDPSKFIRHMKYSLLGLDGLEVSSFETDAHPEKGLQGFRVGGGMTADLVLVVTTAEARGKMVQALAMSEVAGPLKKIAELYDAGDMQGVVSEADSVLASNADVVAAHYIRGVALWRLGRLDEAQVSLTRTLELDPDTEDAEGVLGTVLVERGLKLHGAGQTAEAEPFFEQAVAHLERGLEQKPDAAHLETNLAVALDHLGRTDELQGVLEHLIEVDPNNIQAYFRLADIYTRAGRGEEALEILDSIPSTEQDTAVAMYNVAVGFYNNGEYDMALVALGKATRIEPDHPKIRELMGRCYLAKGDNASALRELKRFLELAPDDPEAELARQIVAALEKEGS
jgi:tetratricopeptide (TPR) repeat protein